MNESILMSVKKLLGILPGSTEFDADIIMNINAAFFTLSQLGVGPSDGFVITGDMETFEDFLGADSTIEQNQVRMYLFYKTKLGFDPPQSSIVMESIKEMIREAEWRLNVQVENNKQIQNEVFESVEEISDAKIKEMWEGIFNGDTEKGIFRRK